jgi:hypothetical protein
MSWLPTDLGASLALWLDAADSGTVILRANTDFVERWNDKSSSGFDASQLTASSQPTYLATGFNGNPTLQTDGADFLEFGVTSLGRNVSGLTCAIVGVHPAGQTFNQNATEIFISSGATFATRFATTPNPSASTVNRYAIAGRRLDTDGYETASSSTDSLANRGNPWIRVAQRAYSDGVANHWTDGTQDITNATMGTQGAGNTSDTDSLRAEVFAGVAAQPNGTQLSEIVLTHSTMTTTDRQKLEGYLAWKWGGVPETRLWTPYDLGTSLAVWLDAADTSRITLNGTTVSQWDDKSGNGRHVSQANATQQPAFTANALSNKPVLTFDGVNDTLRRASAGLTGLSSVSMFVVMRYITGGASEDIALGVGTAGFAGTIRSLYRANGGTTQGWANWAKDVQASAFSCDIGGGYHIFAGWNTSLVAGNNIVIARDGLSAVYTNDGGNLALTGDGLGVGELVGSSIRYTNASIAEVVILPVAVTVTQQQFIEGYLAHKWGLEDNLPVGHPYKSGPPTVEVY